MFHFNYGQPHLSMENYRQATLQQPRTNHSEMLHQYNDSNSRQPHDPSLQEMNLRLVNHLQQFSLLHPLEIRHFTSSHLSHLHKFQSSVHWQLIGIYCQ